MFALREKSPDTEFFLVRMIPHSDWISVFSPNAGKYGPEKTPYLDSFHAVLLFNYCEVYVRGAYKADTSTLLILGRDSHFLR